MSGASCGQNPRKRPPRAKYQREALEASALAYVNGKWNKSLNASCRWQSMFSTTTHIY